MTDPDTPPHGPSGDPGDAAGSTAPSSLGERILRIPAIWRRLAGVVGVVLAIGLLAVGLGSFESGSTPVSVPDSVIRGSLVRPSR